VTGQNVTGQNVTGQNVTGQNVTGQNGPGDPPAGGQHGTTDPPQAGSYRDPAGLASWLQAGFARQSLRRSGCYSWMFSGWMHAAELVQGRRGTEFVTIGVPDDFYAVRVGLANLSRSSWTASKIIACASGCWNDYINPLDAAGVLRPSSAWSPVTFGNGGADRSSLVTAADAPDEIVVAAKSHDSRADSPPAGDAPNPAWTFTDWVPCASAAADPVTGMRVLMLRALVPDRQVITYTNGAMDGFAGRPELHAGYDYFLGGMCHGQDRVTDPAYTAAERLQPAILTRNRIANGPVMCLIQVMTRHAGIVGLVTGDSHHAGTATTSQTNNFLLRCLLPLGRETRGTLPIGLVNTASGGLTSGQFFPRMTALLPAVRPAFVVLPGWSYNETNEGIHANQTAQNRLFARLLLAAEVVRQAGAVPVFVTPFPRDPTSMTKEVRSVWLACRDTLLTLRCSGELVLDATPLLGATTNGEFTGTYLDGLSLDQMHPNDAGHAAVARALTPIVRQFAGLGAQTDGQPPAV
jgi:hypothetical protein